MMAERWDEEEYIDWLDWRLGLEKRIDRGILRHLNNIEFVWILDNDRRRAMDGTALRAKYPEFPKMPNILKNRPCSVLEMLAALAIRMDEEWIGVPNKTTAYQPFRSMIVNLDLHKQKTFYQHVVDWMYRRFGYDGKGSIFPLENPDCDQREIEIWSQMMRYISEKY